MLDFSVPFLYHMLGKVITLVKFKSAYSVPDLEKLNMAEEIYKSS